MDDAITFGAQHMRLRDHEAWPEIERSVLHALCRALDIGGLVAFAGAGIGMDYAYPDWNTLAKCVLKQIQTDIGRNSIACNGLDKRYISHAVTAIDSMDARGRMGVLNYCNRLYVRQGSADEFGMAVKAALDAATKQALGDDRRRPKQKQLFRGLNASNRHVWEPEGNLTTLSALISELRIRRFVTTNYDALIEQRLGPQLMHEGRIPETRHLDPDKRPPEGSMILVSACPSIDRMTASSSEVAAFAMSGGNWRYGVLHLHGRMIDIGRNSTIVLTESQYQQQYESDLTDLRDRRDAYELLLQANALLFVGCSLEDEDSLRPLRRFVADHDVADLRRPWFAILDGRGMNDDEKFDRFQQLYFRYGIAPIFTAGDSGTPIGRSHVKLIEDIARLWLEYRRSRTSLPAMRSPIFSAKPEEHPRGSRLMVHHANEYPPEFEQKDALIAKTIEPFIQTRATKNRGGLQLSLLVLGRQGSGKGSFGYQAAKAALNSEQDTIRFYGTTLFSNEFMTLIDGAANHVSRTAPQPKPSDRPQDGGSESRVARFFRVVRECNANVVVVFGGIERVLRPLPYGASAGQSLSVRPNDDLRGAVIPGAPVATGQGASRNIRWGRPATAEIEEFFRHLIEFNGKSRDKNKKIVLVTSSMSPVLGKAEALSKNVLDNFDKVYIERNPSRQQQSAYWPQIRSRLASNKYAIDTIQRISASMDSQEADEWLKWVNFDIRRTEFANAPLAAIQAAINLNSARSKSRDPGLLAAILEILSLFSTPVEPSVVGLAVPIWYRSQLGVMPNDYDWASTLETIYLNTGLVLKIGDATGMYVETRYTTHSLVRKAVLRRLGGRPDRPAEIQQFDLNEFASEPPEVQSVTPAVAEKLLLIFDAIMTDAEALQLRHDDSDSEKRPHRRLIRARLRAAYSLLRGGWSATGLGRFIGSDPAFGGYQQGSLYHRYCRRLTRLLNLIYRHAPPPKNGDDQLSREAALYPDELGWLLNELGLVCFSQGVLADALTYFGMGGRLNALTEKMKPGYRSIVSRINTALVLIELARLRQARDHLHQAMTNTNALGVDAGELRARIQGYIGLIAHLSGDSRRALELYDIAIQHLHHLESWRGVSVFSRHKCDMLRAEGRFDDAERALREAISAAETGLHLDLVHYCRISEANLRRVRKDPQNPAKPSMLTPTLQFAQTIGSAKIESDVFRVRGLIELENSDLEAATRSTMACLASSRANGLRLRMMSSMELLGRLMAQRGYKEQARSIFRTVIQMGQVYEYQRPLDFAQGALADLERH